MRWKQGGVNNHSHRFTGHSVRGFQQIDRTITFCAITERENTSAFALSIIHRWIWYCVTLAYLFLVPPWSKFCLRTFFVKLDPRITYSWDPTNFWMRIFNLHIFPGKIVFYVLATNIWHHLTWKSCQCSCLQLHSCRLQEVRQYQRAARPDADAVSKWLPGSGESAWFPAQIWTRKSGEEIIWWRGTGSTETRSTQFFPSHTWGDLSMRLWQGSSTIDSNSKGAATNHVPENCQGQVSLRSCQKQYWTQEM